MNAPLSIEQIRKLAWQSGMSAAQFLAAQKKARERRINQASVERLIAEREIAEMKRKAKREIFERSWECMIEMASQVQKLRLIAGCDDAVPCYVSMASIREFVSRRYGVSLIDMDSPSRTARLKQPRLEFYWLCRKLTTNSFESIGKLCGGRDHSTVAHGTYQYERLQRVKAGAERPKPMDNTFDFDKIILDIKPEDLV